MHQPWPFDTDWFDRSLDAFDPFTDPFNHPLFDTHWSDELLFPSLIAAPRHETNIAERPPPKDLSKTVRFYVDITGFSRRDLTIKTQGQNLLITGLKTSCDFSSCYERRYCLKRRLPTDVDFDTLVARKIPGSETLQIEAQRKIGIKGDVDKNIQLTSTANDMKKEQTKKSWDSDLNENIKRGNTEEEEETTIEVVPEE